MLAPRLPSIGPFSFLGVLAWLQNAFPARLAPLSPSPPTGWPPRPVTAAKKPNLLVMLFNDVGCSDFGCYGSTTHTPTIDARAARGACMTGFHTYDAEFAAGWDAERQRRLARQPGRPFGADV